jgi:alpha-beta hydrolase superfamily lysophospholipase
MDVLIALVQTLFRVHNVIYRLTGLEHRLPHAVPAIAPEEAARGGAWGYLRSEGQQLFYRRWLPHREPDGALLAVHGAGAHGGHFRVIGEHLGPRGLAFYSVDLPGHGLSEGERGAAHDTDRIYRAMIDTLAFMSDEHPGRPLFVLGESLAALYALAVASLPRRPAAFAGIVLSGAELVPQQTSPAPPGTAAWVQVARFVRYLLYALFLSRWGVVDIAGREELVTRRKEQAEEAKRDPLRTNQLSMQTLVESYRVIRSAYRLAARVTLPTLILQAGADLVTDPHAAELLRDALAAPDRELIYFADARHGLFYDPDTPKVLATLEGWLSRHTAVPLGVAS